jgi:hypothetical protein
MLNTKGAVSLRAAFFVKRKKDGVLNYYELDRLFDILELSRF